MLPIRSAWTKRLPQPRTPPQALPSSSRRYPPLFNRHPDLYSETRHVLRPCLLQHQPPHQSPQFKHSTPGLQADPRSCRMQTQYPVFSRSVFQIGADDADLSRGPNSRRYNHYIYSRNLMIRKSIDNDPHHHLVYCTHCTRIPWRVPVKFIATRTLLSHLSRRHPDLPTSQEEENLKLQESLPASSTGTVTRSTPFSSSSSGEFSHRVSL